MNRSFISYFVTLLLCFLFPLVSPVFAVGEFDADYDVQYAISPTGTTIVTQNISLTNKQTNLYPQKYSVVLDSTKIKNVIAYDSHDLVKTDITQDKGKTQIVLTFNDKIVGIGKKMSFTLRFENGDIAQKNGTIWEINIPGVKPDGDIASYTVSLSVPQSFGPNAYTSPLPAAGSRWTRDQMMQGGITAAYGTAQAFNARLSYFINNPAITTIKAEIAIPPDTAYQTVVLESIEPRPDTIYSDPDGNWMAVYTLLPTQSKEIEVTLHIDVHMRPRPGYTDPVPDINLLTSKQKYWESDDPTISSLSKTYNTPKKIYDYVVSTLGYDYDRVTTTPIRKGAAEAILSAENSICMEFTDLFIAIARAAGIPARESLGYAYTTNSRLRPLSLVADILHAWPEYYDAQKKVWIAVDPTWANTTGGINYFDKLDFNHITFARHGISSVHPYPAGFYRKQGKTTKDVDISFAEARTRPTAKLTLSFDFPQKVTAGLPAHGTLTIENTTGVSSDITHILIQSTPIDIAYSKTEDSIPPYARIAIPITLKVPNYTSSGNGRLVATVNGLSQQFNFSIQPITMYFIIPIASFTLMIVIILTLVGYRLRLWKRFKRQ